MNNVQKECEQGSRKSLTAQRHEGLHARLLDAAERMVAADGLASLRARALAEAVGCSVGAIYGVFADLDALVLAVNGRTLDAVGAALQAAGGPGLGKVAASERLVRLADAYLGYAVAHRARWQALFQHRMPPGRAITPDYAARQAAAFAHVEGPLAALRPDLAEDGRALLARTLFSAVHGMVELGLDEKVAAVPVAALRGQVRMVVEAVARGLGAGR